MLSGKKVLLAISGSIAAYKAILLLRLLVKQGAEVKVVMTTSAKDFVSPLVLSTLSGYPVLSDLSEGDSWSNHVMLGRWADLMIIAPLSCNTLAKMASGQCDNLLMAVYLSAVCPVMVSPAMDEDMWHHATTRRNIETIKADAVEVLPVEHGALASGLVGEGRMAEPEFILSRIEYFFGRSNLPLSGKKALITAGPTYEPIDPVRFIGNHSSGKMGIAIAEALARKGASVKLMLGPTNLRPANDGIEVITVTTAVQMYDATVDLFAGVDIAVMAAAVADYRPAKPYDSKWKKNSNEGMPPIELTENPDILRYCGTNKRENQVVVGFALETDNAEENAQKKLVSKNADMIVLNSLQDEGSGFGTATNKITIFEKQGSVQRLSLQSKTNAASIIADTIIQRFIYA